MFTIRDFINRAKNIISAADIESACRERSVISSEMAAELLNWNDIYQNKAAWLNKDSDTKSLNLGVSIAAEFARLVMLELKSEVNEKDARGKFINGVYQKYLEKLRPAVERACALGGVCFKPYVADGEIKVDVIDPLDFIPLESDDEGIITAAVLLSRKDKGAKRYTKLEVHKFSNNSEQVRNICYCSSVP
ncbi:MAG: phage portal protein, partial [Clostridia bacterium]|nr:phage portal protein [Clostridia bacterium]